MIRKPRNKTKHSGVCFVGDPICPINKFSKTIDFRWVEISLTLLRSGRGIQDPEFAESIF
jgi:hypothetical protein